MAFNVLQDYQQIGAGGELTTAQEAVVASLNSLSTTSATSFVQKNSATTFANAAFGDITSINITTALAYVGQAAGSVPFTVQGAAGQTANLLNVKNSAGTVMFGVDPSGNLTIAGSATVSVNEAITGALTLTGTLSVTGATTLSSTLSVAGITSLTGGFFLPDNTYAIFGNLSELPDVRFGWNTAQTVDALFLGLSDAQNTFIIAENGDRAFDFAHGAATNPTLFIHSASQSTTQWISLTHDQTNGVIDVGTGVVSIPDGLTTTTATATTSVTSPLIVGGAGAGATLTFRSTSSAGATDALIFQVGNAGATEAMRLTSAGLALHGGTVAYGLTSQKLETNTSAASGGIAMNSWTTTTAAQGSTLVFQKAKSATVGTMTTVVTQDTLGMIDFNGSDGVSFRTAAQIRGEVDGNVTGGGAADMPGRLVFYTTADGSATPTSRLTLDRTGTFFPSTNDGVALGKSSNTFSDLFLASGAVIDFNSDIVLTHAQDILAHSGGTFIFGATAVTTAYGRLGESIEINTSDNYGGTAINTWSTTADQAGFIDFNRSKSASIGTKTIVASGDRLGSIYASGADGTNWIESAIIQFHCDGTPGVNDMPGRMSFWTTLDGASSSTERMRINNAGAVIIGSASSTINGQFEVVGSTPTAVLRNTTAASYTSFRLYNDQNSSARALEIDYSGSTYASPLLTGSVSGESAAIATVGAYPLALGTTNIARINILAGGAVLVNGAAAYGRLGQLFETNVTANYGGAALNAWSATAAQATVLDFNRSKSATIGTQTIVASGDNLGHIVFRGSDGAAFQDAAMILVSVDGTPGLNDMPGRISFQTTPDGSTTLVQRMTILNSGVVTIGGTTNTSYGQNTQLLELNTTAVGGGTLNAWTGTTAGNAATWEFARSRGASIGTSTIVASGDALGYITWRGATGSGFADAAGIQAHIDGTPGAGTDMPGRLSFWTSPDGSATITERMTIKSAGNINIRSELDLGVDNADAATNLGLLRIYSSDNPSVGAGYIRINATQANITGADVFMAFDSTSGTEATIAGTGAAGVIAYNTWTASHFSQSDSIEKHKAKKKNMTENHPNGEFTDVYESDLEMCSVLVTTEEMCKWEGDISAHLPKSKVSDKPMDKRVYGVFGGYDIDGDILVLAGGVGYVLVCDEGGEIEIGDLLCTSSTPGYAMKYTGTDMAVVGFKAREDFSGKQGKIACNYLAG